MPAAARRTTARRTTARRTTARRTTARVVACLLAGSLLAAGGAYPAHARSDGETRQGHCSGPAHWRLGAQTDDGRIEVRGEVKTQSSGRRWRWRILHDGGVSARGYARTDGGGFDIERLLVNAPGTDRIGWRTRSLRSGQTCRGHVRI